MTAPTSVSLKDLLFADLEAELAATRKTLERFPDEHAAWKPHQKSSSLQDLARHVAELPAFASVMLTTDTYDVANVRREKAPVSTAADLLAMFDRTAGTLREAVAAVTDEQLGQTWAFTAGAHTVVSGPRAVMLRRMGLTHLAHHRAQLGVYYRLLDVPVPGLFGPSADER
ncbi:MAG TPA: DinB family protein [Gemmatimonadaceae bacterium]|nr:DinB family protein [Gemmatimonadaceae bacterium]